VTTVRPARQTLVRPHYAGAVYGSLLAASVAAGTAADGTSLAPLDLAIALLGTGVAFWVAHAYARVVGEGVATSAQLSERVWQAAVGELPIVGASIPPAAVALLGWAVGLGPGTITMFALCIAIAGQVGWAVFASTRAGLSRRWIVGSGAVNLAIGSVILLLEISLH
jgi:hypothetical protein